MGAGVQLHGNRATAGCPIASGIFDFGYPAWPGGRAQPRDAGPCARWLYPIAIVAEVVRARR